MALINEKEFESLSNFKNDVCISIFIPTRRKGKEVLEGENQLSLKSRWQETKRKLEKDGVSQELVRKMEGPMSELLNNKEFWRHQSDGLAVFASENLFKYFTLPIHFDPYCYISREFYLKPLTPVFSGDGQFYILALQIEKVELYQATRYGIDNVDIKDLAPARLEERVGYDYEEKHRKHKTQHNMGGAATQHGYDAANRDRKNEFLRFFRAVDTGLHSLLNGQEVPLVVACQDYLFPIYREANTYKHLYRESIPGNPVDYPNRISLHAAAVKVLEPYFNREKLEKASQFRESNPGRTSVQLTDIIPAIYEGKVDSLFVQNHEEEWGRYDEGLRKVKIDTGQNSQNTSLLNLAAVRTIREGGSVYLTDEESMPDNSSKLNALFRYK